MTLKLFNINNLAIRGGGYCYSSGNHINTYPLFAADHPCDGNIMKLCGPCDRQGFFVYCILRNK